MTNQLSMPMVWIINYIYILFYLTLNNKNIDIIQRKSYNCKLGSDSTGSQMVTNEKSNVKARREALECLCKEGDCICGNENDESRKCCFNFLSTVVMISFHIEFLGIFLCKSATNTLTNTTIRMNTLQLHWYLMAILIKYYNFDLLITK